MCILLYLLISGLDGLNPILFFISDLCKIFWINVSSDSLYTHIKLMIIINGILYIVIENAKCIWMFPLIIKHLLSQKSRVSNDEFRPSISQVKAYLCKCVRLHLRSMTFDLIAERASLGGLLCNLNLVIITFLSTHWSSSTFTLLEIASDGFNSKQRKVRCRPEHTERKTTMTVWLWDTRSHGGLAPDNRLLCAAPSRFVVVAVVGSEQRETVGEMSRRQVLSAPETPCGPQ